MAGEVHFTVQKNDQVGRFAVAAKDLKPGEVIFSETPFAYGPKPDHPPMCLGCFLPVDCSYLCSTCGWPVCDEFCETKSCHKDAECEVFSKACEKFQTVADPSDVCIQYECITPIRVLIASEKNQKRWDEEVKVMEAHNEKRKTLPIWNFNHINVVEYLRGRCKLDRFPEELIHTVCGILEVNAFEAHPINGGYSIRCLYPKLAILSHNCVSNINHSIQNDCIDAFTVIVRASIDVKTGEELFSSYTYALSPTLVRRTFLKESKYFECACKRCSDATELGTHMGTLKCSKCDNGVILSTAPLDFDAAWKCTHCAFTTSARAVLRVYQTIQADIDNVDADVEEASQAIEARETLFRKYRSVLHPRNAYHSILRLSLAQMYGKVEGYSLEDLPDLLLEHKVELCMGVLENLNIVEPGCNRTRGMILYELHAPLILLARNYARNKLIDKKGVRSKLEKAISALEEAVNILSLEPAESTEGQIAIGAKNALMQLQMNIEDLIEAQF